MRAPTHRTALLGVVLLAFLPLATDGGQAECWNAATSLTSTAAGPVNGDEAFFKSPTGPANVMFLLDVSGSMDNFPQCGDPAWDGGAARCTSPALPDPGAVSSTATSQKLYTVTGTCAVSGDIAWMASVVPTTAKPDPGRTNALLTDNPPWGDSCTGDNCLFDPKAYYNYQAWHTTDTASWATRRAHDDSTTGLPAACTAIDRNGNVINDVNGKAISLGSDCTNCMNNSGFYFFRMNVYGGKDRWGRVITNSYANPIFKGTFLNANPPKFVTARKVIKDVAWMDKERDLDKVRLGLAIINPTNTSTDWRYPVYPIKQARLIVPLGPDKGSAHPPTQANFQQARQYILSVLNFDTTSYMRGTVQIVNGSTISSGFFNPANGWTPLGTALFNVGQYFATAGFYNSTFGPTYVASGFDESSAGDVNAPWAQTGYNQCSVCWLCQNNSVVIVTDGSPNSEANTPAIPTSVTGWNSQGFNLASNCGGTPNCVAPMTSSASILPRVGNWLHENELRTEGTSTDTQKLTVHTVGIGIPAGSPQQILRATANLSGGIFQNAEDPAQLGAAVYNAINQVLPRLDSFSASAAASLQTVQTAATQAFLTRFKPNSTPTWEGHVFETFIFDEHTAGCDPATPDLTVKCQDNDSVRADFNGDGLCTGVFMVDSDCDRIADDANTGELVKSVTTTATPATIPWDAGRVLSTPGTAEYRSAADPSVAGTAARTIFTYLGTTRTEFTKANASTILPYLDISSAWCTAFLTRIGFTPTGTASTDQLTCAQQLIYFVRGYDTLDQDKDSCAAPGNPKNSSTTCRDGEERDRKNDHTADASARFFWKLGDIFHSSPAVVTAPITEGRCATGYENQCVMTIYSPPVFPNFTPTTQYSGGTIDAYEAYRQDHQKRKRVVMVGANDGMLHGFEAGDPDFASSADVTGQYPYGHGTGTELWAFIPPDMLPRLKDLVQAHQYMVDGSPMVRDVWVDGSGSEVAGVDGKKQKDEFHTVLVFGRRSGGNVWTALDVTDPLAPVLLWNWPDVTTGDDARWVGQSWAEFAPRPPPIGPVRLARSADPRGFEERWVVMLPGGYDPMLNMGRAVFMLDVWTGKTVWRWTNADFRAQHGYDSSTSMFPVTGAPSMVDIGDAITSRSQDGMFDTATWADLGGNVFVARFNEIGKLDEPPPSGTGRVLNWYAARAFEEQRRTDDAQYVPGRSEFYFMPGNAWDASANSLRTFVGSGNREKITAQDASCGTDNLMGCCQAGCSGVTARSTYRSGTCEQSLTFSCSDDALSFVTTTAGTCSPLTCASPGPGAYSAYQNVKWTCSAAGTIPDATGTALWDGAGIVTVSPIVSREIVPLTNQSFRAQTKSRFYGIRTYGGSHTFMDPSGAVTFEKQRLTDVTYAASCPWTGTSKACKLVDTTPSKISADTSNPSVFKNACQDGSTKCQAIGTDPGWYYEYGDYCPLGSCSPAPPWTDEKTGAAGQIIQSCLLFSAFRPVGQTTSTDPCSGNRGSSVAYDYRFHWISGTANKSTCGTIVPATQRSITSPPSAAIARVDILTSKPGGGGGGTGGGGSSSSGGGCAGGGMSFGALNLDPGSAAQKTAISTESCAVENIYWLEVSRDEHACRHEPGGAAACR